MAYTNKTPKHNIEVGDTVKYQAVHGWFKVKVLRVKEDGKLILFTNNKSHVGLIKNVCVLPHRVELVKKG